MEAPDALSLEAMVALLEHEARLYGNMSAKQYLNSLQISEFGDSAPLDTNAGLAWVVVIPVIYFSSVALVMTLLLISFRQSEIHKAEEAQEGGDGVVETAFNGDVRPEGQVDHEHERSVPSSTGISTNAKGTAFLRGYMNAAGEIEGSARASGTSKGSVRSLGVLAELERGGMWRPRLPSLHPNPPSAPSTLPMRGMTAFNLLARRRLSKSIDELRDETRVASGPAEWSGFGGRSSLEMNITPGGPRLTLLGSEMTSHETKPGNRQSNSSTDSVEDKTSRDSLRASMELHIKDVGSGLRAGDLYGQFDRSFGPLLEKVKKNNLVLRKQGSASSSSNSRSTNTDAVNNLTLMSSGMEISNTSSHTYSDIVTFNRNTSSINGEDVKRPGKELRHSGYENYFFSKLNSEIPKKRFVSTKNVGSSINTTGNNIINNYQSTDQEANSSVLANQSQVTSWSSASDICHIKLSPSQRGRPLSLDMLTFQSEIVENRPQRAMVVKKPVPRQLFATIPQMSQKTSLELALNRDEAIRSAPARQTIGNPYIVEYDKSEISLKGLSGDMGRRGGPHPPENNISNSLNQKSYACSLDDLPDIDKTQGNSLSKPRNKSYLPTKIVSSHLSQGDSYSAKQETGPSSYTGNGGLFYHHQPQGSLHPDSSGVYKYGQQADSTNRCDPHNRESSTIKPGDINVSLTPGQITAVSVWPSPGTSQQATVSDLGDDESSADSIIDSLSSSIAQFHAQRLDGENLLCAKYPLTNDVSSTVDDPLDPAVLANMSADTSKADLSFSLAPNPGSRNPSPVDEAKATISYAGSGTDTREDPLVCAKTLLPPAAAYSKVQETSLELFPQHRFRNLRPPLSPSTRIPQSLLGFARNVFSRPPGGPAVSASPAGQSLELERSVLSAESLSDSGSILNDRRVTLEQRLSEYGLIKTTGGTVKFVVNPSPSKFSGRTAQSTPVTSYNVAGQGGDDGVKGPSCFCIDDMNQQGQKREDVSSNASHVTEMHSHKMDTTKQGTCTSEYRYGNKQADREREATVSKVIIEELKDMSRPSVRAMRNHFLQ